MRKILPWLTIGDDRPLPGTGDRQRTLGLSALHRVGRFVALERPSPWGPRNCGHSPANRSGGEGAQPVTRTAKAARHSVTEVVRLTGDLSVGNMAADGRHDRRAGTENASTGR